MPSEHSIRRMGNDYVGGSGCVSDCGVGSGCGGAGAGAGGGRGGGFGDR